MGWEGAVPVIQYLVDKTIIMNVAHRVRTRYNGYSNLNPAIRAISWVGGANWPGAVPMCEAQGLRAPIQHLAVGARAVQPLLRCPHTPRSHGLSPMLAWVNRTRGKARHPALPVTGWGMGALRAKRAGPHIRMPGGAEALSQLQRLGDQAVSAIHPADRWIKV